ncbi:MAG: pyruvoyl-dependent arginine decarboxylase [Promethearchaeota archaeon]
MTQPLIPRNYFFATGVGFHDNKIISFEYALRMARCEKYNLVPVSSIIPPNCIEISRELGLKKLSTGEIVFCVMGRISTEKKNVPVSSIVTSIKSNEIKHGYFFEYCKLGPEFSKTIMKSKIRSYQLITSLEKREENSDIKNIDFSRKIEIIKMKDRIFQSRGTQKIDKHTINWQGISTSNGTKKKWMTLIALAVFSL